MPLTLAYQGETSIPVEIEGLTPDRVAGQSLAEIERFEIFHGNERLPLAEMFRVQGDPSDGRFDFEGNLAGVHWIGAHLKQGEIHVHGNGGRHIGSEMHGGRIVVQGDASDWVGGEMHGGLIDVRGRAGHLIGAAYRGSARGMTGGTILIRGPVGNEIGHTMRRGLIAVGGADDMLGFNMIAGTILVCGPCGIRPGAGMRRGTIGLLGDESVPLLPTFRFACQTPGPALTLILRDLRARGYPIDDLLLDTQFDLFTGDLVSLGRGELFLRSPRAA